MKSNKPIVRTVVPAGAIVLVAAFLGSLWQLRERGRLTQAQPSAATPTRATLPLASSQTVVPKFVAPPPVGVNTREHQSSAMATHNWGS